MSNPAPQPPLAIRGITDFSHSNWKPPNTQRHEEDLLEYETDRGMIEHKNAGERMSKEQREKASFRRILAYCLAGSFRMKPLASFLKREHNVKPRIYDEGMYVMYHLPLLPGYGPGSNIRSSAPPTSTGTGNEDPSSGLSEAEEDGYQGTYFTYPSTSPRIEGYMPSASPETLPHRPSLGSGEVRDAVSSEQHLLQVEHVLSPEDSNPAISPSPSQGGPTRSKRSSRRAAAQEIQNFVKAIFFEYGVVVFFGLREDQELGIVEDIEGAGIMTRPIPHDDWEVEACHYSHDPSIAFPRIYNDFFTFKTHSHLLQLSVAHALAQSTLLAHYESLAHRTRSIPVQLASTGVLALSRMDALKLTGRLFTLRRDVNLVSNVLDTPELFWDEASLKALYDAIGPRVQVLNEKVAVAEDLVMQLSAIHDHLNNNAMDQITWIIIWLIVVACLVEVGEVIARLVVHATMGGGETTPLTAAQVLNSMSREEAASALERIAHGLPPL
ncbi:hypothetical protein C8Q74DRAFT_1319416 [Fomes fomentarius]|nr:hypothetical protein C8Q74DRAFT_1319416 [Fomes fomentarius]